MYVYVQIRAWAYTPKNIYKPRVTATSLDPHLHAKVCACICANACINTKTLTNPESLLHGVRHGVLGWWVTGLCVFIVCVVCEYVCVCACVRECV